ncbi:MAG: hypothetical protein ACLVB3_09460 [Clostridium sp.]
MAGDRKAVAITTSLVGELDTKKRASAMMGSDELSGDRLPEAVY